MSPAPAEVQAEWARRVVAEYRSAAAAQELALWLLQIGASPDLVRDAQRTAVEELDHAERSAEVLAAAGGAPPGPVDRASLSLRRGAGPLEHDVLLAGVELYCVGETVAVPLFRRMLADATVPLVQRTLTRILADEARHRRFGWTLLDALLGGSDGPALRVVLAHALPGMRARVEDAYGADTGSAAPLSTQARAWGLLSSAVYDEELRRTAQRWYRPRFAAAGLSW